MYNAAFFAERRRRAGPPGEIGDGHIIHHTTEMLCKVVSDTHVA